MLAWYWLKAVAPQWLSAMLIITDKKCLWEAQQIT
jgi:hypothetical protein